MRAPAARPARPAVPSRSLRVLVADDTEVVRLSLTRGLALLGCTVHTARDGAEALEMARGNPYDLILLDLNMEGMGGGEAARAIARDYQARGLARPKLVAISAEPPPACQGQVIDGFLEKPVRLDQLAALLASAMEGAGIRPPGPVVLAGEWVTRVTPRE